ncbi:MAG: alkylmercury lyase family protein [Thiogranum sp.]
MTAKLDKALNRLKSILPLKEQQDDCSKQIRELHQQVLRSFVDKGRILTRDEMAQHVGNLEDAVNVLKEKDMVIFSTGGNPVGAYPFTMEAREHAVRINGHQVYAMCALDALAVSPMFGMETQIASRCRITGEPVCIQQSGKTIVNLDEAGDIHFGIIWGAANTNSCCADSLCMEMMFLRDAETAQQWLADDPDNREVFTLQEAVEFGGRFFAPLLS